MVPDPTGRGEICDPPARLDRRCILLLLVLAVAIRAWTIPHTVVPARDAIGFMRYAWQLQHDNWIEVLRSSHHPPGYPLTILALALPLGNLMGDHFGAPLDLAAQLAANLAGTLLVVPMFLLGRELFDRRTGFWAALLFQCLPVSARVLSDALSEPLFLLASAAALWMAACGIKRTTNAIWKWFFPCGMCAGVAYLTRPEGALLVVAISLVLLFLTWRPAEWTRPRLAVGLLCLWFGAAILAGPYIATIGHLTQKPTGQDVFKVAGQINEEPPKPKRLLMAMWFAEDGPKRIDHLGWCCRAVLFETAKGFHYVGLAALALGLWWFRDRFRRTPGLVILLLLAVLHAGLLVRVAMVSGYISERHTLLLLLCGLYWAAAAVGLVGDRIAQTLFHNDRGHAAATLFLLMVLSALPYSLRPLHCHRAGFREAGHWLAEHAAASDAIIDPFGWAAHYAGRSYQKVGVSESPSVNRYFVWDCTKPSYQRALVEAGRVRELQQGQPVYHWPVEKSVEKATVIVYFLPPASSDP